MTSRKKNVQGVAPSKKRKTGTLLNFVKNPFSHIEFCEESVFPHIEFCEESVFFILNFVKSSFFSYSILWTVRFSNVEFCEISVNGLNFPPRHIPGKNCLSVKFSKLKFCCNYRIKGLFNLKINFLAIDPHVYLWHGYEHNCLMHIHY